MVGSRDMRRRAMHIASDMSRALQTSECLHGNRRSRTIAHLGRVPSESQSAFEFDPKSAGAPHTDLNRYLSRAFKTFLDDADRYR